VSWRDDWIGLSGRIDGLLDAAKLYMQTAALHRGDPTGVADKNLIPQIEKAIEEVRKFRDVWRPQISEPAVACIDGFLSSIDGFRGQKAFFGIRSLITPLVTFRAELEHCMADRSAIARSLTERAFSHLRRSLIASRPMREEWRSVFAEKREESIEKLGAAHLLLHGIWAFKANAADSAGRTDLVLSVPMTAATTGEAERVSEALVLTEWKKVVAGDDPEEKANEAQAQARMYSSGVLGGVELRDTKYLVLVSAGESQPIDDREADGVRYRVVQIAIDPSVPSVAARRSGRR